MTEPLDIEAIKARYPSTVEWCDDPGCWECQAMTDLAALIAEVERLQRQERIMLHYRRWLERIEMGVPPKTCAAHALDGAMGIP